MQDLRVVGVQSGALLLATDAGGEYRLPVTHALHSQIRSASPGTGPAERKAPPREIQAQIRAGRSSAQVAEATGADLDFVRRFEGPVLAERAFVLESAFAVTVSVATDGPPAPGASTFGAVIEARLDTAEATSREWSSYKHLEHGWTVRVSYVVGEVEREAEWLFDPKKHVLAPRGGDAHVLSQHSEDVGPLVPRLRDVDHDRGADRDEPSRFDSGAFALLGDPVDDTLVEPAVERQRTEARSDSRSAASLAATNRAPESASSSQAQTADLLEALRRRRGERESARFSDDDHGTPTVAPVRIIDVPLDDFDLPEGTPTGTPAASVPDDAPLPSDPRDEAPRSLDAARGGRGRSARGVMPAPTTATPKKNRGRTAMPSWDEIVFGARSDDDPA